MKKIFITGVSGTGKTTLSEELKKQGFHAISIDEVKGLCSWRNKETNEKITRKVTSNKEFTNTHKWVCDIDKLKELIEIDSEIVFILGMPSNREEIALMCDKVFLLQCKPETFLHRLNTRTNNTFGKDVSIQQHMLQWYEGFEKELLDKGAIPIDTDRPVDQIAFEVIEKAKSNF